MKQIVFFSTPAYGHLISVYPVISQLVKEGNEVSWYCSAKYKDLVLKSGARYEEYIGDFDAICDLQEATDNLFNLFENLLQLNRQYFLSYNKRIASDDIDMILYDSMCSFAKNLAIKHQIPHICLCTTVAYNAFTFVFSNLFFSTLRLMVQNLSKGIRLVREENRFRKANGISRLDLMDIFMNKGDRTLVFSPKEYQPMAGTFSKDFQFVGTTVKDRINLDETIYSDYDIYISLGSIMTEKEKLLQQLQQSPFIQSHKTIMNIGRLNIDHSDSHIEFVHHTNQLELLKHCRLFINHGGLNSIYEGIEHGVVQICIPQQEEQRMNAKILQRKGLGLYMSQWDEKKAEQLEKNFSRYQQNVREFSQIISRHDGTQNAVNVINELLNN